MRLMTLKTIPPTDTFLKVRVLFVFVFLLHFQCILADKILGGSTTYFREEMAR